MGTKVSPVSVATKIGMLTPSPPSGFQLIAGANTIPATGLIVRF